MKLNSKPQEGKATVKGLIVSLKKNNERNPRSAVLVPHKSPASVWRRVLELALAHQFKIVWIGVFLFVIIGGSGTIGSTVSYYADIETSINNTLIADPLGFNVTLEGATAIDMSSGSSTRVAEFTPGEGSEPIQYALSSYMTGGDSTLMKAPVVPL